MRIRTAHYPFLYNRIQLENKTRYRMSDIFFIFINHSLYFLSGCQVVASLHQLVEGRIALTKTKEGLVSSRCERWDGIRNSTKFPC